MANENMQFWESVKKTDPARVKAITGKQYKGNSPQPYYLVERMTESFGMCGIGWGLNILNERMERLTDTDVLHVAVVELWYVHGDKKGAITQIGQTKACYKTSSGSLLVDEDAPKKSVTDAMTKCMSYLGFAGDIFSGQWDDSKYVQQLTNEFSEAKKPAFSIDDAKKIIGACKTIDELKSAFSTLWHACPKAEQKILSAYKDEIKYVIEGNLKAA